METKKETTDFLATEETDQETLTNFIRGLSAPERIYCIRYSWRTSDGKYCFRILTDVSAAHEAFCNAFLQDNSIDLFSSEYLSEYDYSKLGTMTFLKRPVETVEVIKDEKV